MSEHPSLFSFPHHLNPFNQGTRSGCPLTISRFCRWLNKLIDGMPDWRFQLAAPPPPTHPFFYYSRWIWTYPHFSTNATLLLSSSSTCRCVPRGREWLKAYPPLSTVGRKWFRATLKELPGLFLFWGCVTYAFHALTNWSRESQRGSVTELWSRIS